MRWQWRRGLLPGELRGHKKSSAPLPAPEAINQLRLVELLEADGKMTSAEQALAPKQKPFATGAHAYVNRLLERVK